MAQRVRLELGYLRAFPDKEERPKYGRKKYDTEWNRLITIMVPISEPAHESTKPNSKKNAHRLFSWAMFHGVVMGVYQNA